MWDDLSDAGPETTGVCTRTLPLMDQSLWVPRRCSQRGLQMQRFFPLPCTSSLVPHAHSWYCDKQANAMQLKWNLAGWEHANESLKQGNEDMGVGTHGRSKRHHHEPRGQGDTWWQDEACRLVGALSKLCKILTHWSVLLKGQRPLMLRLFYIFPWISWECQTIIAKVASKRSPPAMFVSSHCPLCVWISVISRLKLINVNNLILSGNSKREKVQFVPLLSQQMHKTCTSGN